MPDPTETHEVLVETFDQPAKRLALPPSAETQPAENQATKRAGHTGPLNVYRQSQRINEHRRCRATKPIQNRWPLELLFRRIS